MANYVRNVLVFNGEEKNVEDVCNFLRSDAQAVDLDKILPTPIFTYPSEAVYWQRNSWGSTNALDCMRNTKNILSFSTEFSSPFKAINLLARKFPDVEICLWWADEEKGVNEGMVKWADGKIVDDIIPFSDSKASDDIYYYCWNSVRIKEEYA